MLIQVEKDRNKRLRDVCTVLNEMFSCPFPAVCYFKYLLGINSPRIKLLCSIFIVMKIIIIIVQFTELKLVLLRLFSQSKVYNLNDITNNYCFMHVHIHVLTHVLVPKHKVPK